MAARSTKRVSSPIVDAIRAEMKRQGVTGYRLAKDAGIRVYTVQRLIAGIGSPTLATLEAVAMALRMTLKIEPSE
jgi:transcriptional regulator with XRE-family HTH domain